MTRLGDIVVAHGTPREEVEAAAAAARAGGKRLGEALVARGVLKERDLYRLLGERHHLRYVEADEIYPLVDPGAWQALPRKYSERFGVVLLRVADQIATVVTSDPTLDPNPVLQATSPAARSVEVLLATPTDLARIRAVLELGQTARRDEREEVATRDLLSDAPMTAELVSLFDALLLDAIGERASDIHLEIYGQRVRVRLRIDGDLHDADHYDLSPRQLAGLVNVVKVRSSLDIAERRLPQGGRYATRAGNAAYDLRVQTQPSLHGEHVVIRLLPQDQSLIGINELGFDETVATLYRRMLAAPAGLLLVVGPTGSGKSTTLYAGLQMLAGDPTRKVITIEDPIEYSIDGVQQTQTRPDIGFAFADAMRAFVREDPDVILIGEIRDHETGLEALRASQTGHLVLSTLHCNDAVDAVARLHDLDLHPSSLASELLAVLAQRLAKRICEHCRTEKPPDPAIAREVFPDGVPEGFRCFRGVGCERCRGRGTHGRIAVVEFLPVGRELRRGIARNLPLDDIRDIAVAHGLLPLREAALAHVLAGRIAFEELPWLLPPERLRPEGR